MTLFDLIYIFVNGISCFHILRFVLLTILPLLEVGLDILFPQGLLFFFVVSFFHTGTKLRNNLNLFSLGSLLGGAIS